MSSTPITGGPTNDLYRSNSAAAEPQRNSQHNHSNSMQIVSRGSPQNIHPSHYNTISSQHKSNSNASDLTNALPLHRNLTDTSSNNSPPSALQSSPSKIFMQTLRNRQGQETHSANPTGGSHPSTPNVKNSYTRDRNHTLTPDMGKHSNQSSLPNNDPPLPVSSSNNGGKSPKLPASTSTAFTARKVLAFIIGLFVGILAGLVAGAIGIVIMIGIVGRQENQKGSKMISQKIFEGFVSVMTGSVGVLSFCGMGWSVGKSIQEIILKET